MLRRLYAPPRSALLAAAVAVAGLLSVAGVAHADAVPGSPSASPTGAATGPAPLPSTSPAPAPTANTPTPTPTPTSGTAGTVQLIGYYEATAGCKIFQTYDGQGYYDLELPSNPAPDQKVLIYPGLPADVPLQVTLLPEPGKVSNCALGAQVAIVEAFTQLTSGIELTGIVDSPNNCEVFRSFDNQSYMLVLPSNPTPDQRVLFYPGVPMNVPVRITLMPEPLKAVPAYCEARFEAIVESFTPLS